MSLDSEYSSEDCGPPNLPEGLLTVWEGAVRGLRPPLFFYGFFERGMRGRGDAIYPRIYVRCAGVQCAGRGAA